MGWFITFEGLDGAGKSTQMERLANRLERAGHTVIRTREPGGTLIGDKIRSLLLDPDSNLNPNTEVLLYAASRAEHVQRVIVPAVQAGQVVLCDRFVDASLAYQGAGLQLGVDAVAKVNEFATGGLVPDCTVLFDLPVTASQDRILRSRSGADPDRIERRSAEYFERVREQFLTMANEQPNRMRVVDATLTVDEIEQDIWRIVANLLGINNG